MISSSRASMLYCARADEKQYGMKAILSGVNLNDIKRAFVTFKTKHHFDIKSQRKTEIDRDRDREIKEIERIFSISTHSF